MKRLQLVAALSAVMLAGAAYAQERFPTKNMRMLVPFAAGSQTDILARWIGEEFLKTWNQQTVVDNRPSAGGTVASQVVLDANADGHTMMMVSTGHAGNATLFSKLPYDTIKDFSGVSQVASVPNLLVVAPALGPKSVKDLIALAKSQPGKMNFSSAGIGSGTQINGEMFKLAAGIQVTHVPYKGAPDALNNVIGGNVQFNFAPVLVAQGQVKAGRVLALAVSTASRSPLFPNVPTVAEAGVPDFEASLWFAFFAPSGTLPQVVSKLNDATQKALAEPRVKERFVQMGIELTSGGPAELSRLMKADHDRWKAVVEFANIKLE